MRNILVTEQQLRYLREMAEGNEDFSMDVLTNTNWNNGREIDAYCQRCGMLELGRGCSRVVYEIDEERVIKISVNDGVNQNIQEIDVFNKMPKYLKPFAPNLITWDTKNTNNPLWIIAEQVLPASYADFPKLLGIDFGAYESSADIENMNQELNDFKKYDGKRINKKSLNLQTFLDDFNDGHIEKYSEIIKSNKWLQCLYMILKKRYVFAWELEMIENWGLAMRNGKPQLIILDLGY